MQNEVHPQSSLPKPAPIRPAWSGPTLKSSRRRNGEGSRPSTSSRSWQKPTRRLPTHGAIGALLRREGLYSSHLVMWRRQREASIRQGLEPQKRGPKSKRNPMADENQKLLRENERLTEQLRKAELIIDVQKKGGGAVGIADPAGAAPEHRRYITVHIRHARDTADSPYTWLEPPRPSRILWVASGGWIAARIRSRPRQRGHSRTSI